MDDIIIKLLIGLSVLLVIMIHELAHGFVAYKFGDSTAKNDGRLSLNPLKHLDLIGTLSLIFFNFGWAKPVPVNFNRLRPKKLGAFFVSVAGCLANFLTALLFCILLILQMKYFPSMSFINTFIMLVIFYSISFGVFNLIPIPPLDGSKVLMTFLPYRVVRFIDENEKIFFFILLGLVMTGRLAKITSPAINFISEILMTIAYRIVI